MSTEVGSPLDSEVRRSLFVLRSCTNTHARCPSLTLTRCLARSRSRSASDLLTQFLHEPGSDALIRIPRTLMADLRAMGRGGATAAAAAAAPATPSSPAAPAPAAPVVVVAFDKQIASMLDIDGVIKTASVEKFVSLIELARQQAEKEQTFVLYTLKQSSAKSVFVIEYVSRAASSSPSTATVLAVSKHADGAARRFIKHGGVTALNNWLEHERLSGVTNDKLVLKLFKLLEPLPMTLEVLQRSSVGKTVKKFTASKYSPTIRKLAAKLIGDWMSLIEAKGTTVTPLQHYTPRHATSHTAISMPLATRSRVSRPTDGP